MQNFTTTEDGLLFTAYYSKDKCTISLDDLDKTIDVDGYHYSLAFSIIAEKSWSTLNQCYALAEMLQKKYPNIGWDWEIQLYKKHRQKILAGLRYNENNVDMYELKYNPDYFYESMDNIIGRTFVLHKVHEYQSKWNLKQSKPQRPEHIYTKPIQTVQEFESEISNLYGYRNYLVRIQNTDKLTAKYAVAHRNSQNYIIHSDTLIEIDSAEGKYLTERHLLGCGVEIEYQN